MVGAMAQKMRAVGRKLIRVDEEILKLAAAELVRRAAREVTIVGRRHHQAEWLRRTRSFASTNITASIRRTSAPTRFWAAGLREEVRTSQTSRRQLHVVRVDQLPCHGSRQRSRIDRSVQRRCDPDSTGPIQ
jgi:hypothetical protein